MTVSGFAEQAGAERDPRYRKGMAHLQAGEWDKAIEFFKSLRQEYPANEEIAEALEEARLKAELDAGSRVKGRRWAIPWRSLITVAVVAILLAVIGFAVTRIDRKSVV